MIAPSGFRLLTVSAAFLASGVAASAAEITVMASNAVKEAYSELVPLFEKQSGHKVTIVWGGTIDLKKRIGQGEVADIVITPASDIEDLIRQDLLAAGSRVDLVRSSIGVAIRRGTPRPDLSSGEGLKTSLLASKSIIISGGPSSYYLLGVFDKMGIAAALKPKMTQLASGAPVGEVLAQGRGDIGFTQVSEFLPFKNTIDYVGPLPSDIQLVTVFSSGLHRSAPSPAAAKALVKFLTGPQAVPVLKENGLEPG
jgi:molybdate transport system substrate-binding protein